MLTQNFDKNNYEFNSESTIGIYLIHGFSSSTYELKILAEFLSKKNYHVVLNNLPGHGTTVEDCNQSEYTDWLDFSKIELAKLCSQSNQTFIIGVSMGAVIGLYLSTLFPINGLIIGGTVLKFKLWWNTNVLNTLFCRFIKMRKKELILPKEKRKKTSFYGYDYYPLIALNEFRKMNKVVIKRLNKVKSPILIIHSKNDQVSIKENVELIDQSIQSTEKKILVVKKAHHSVFDTNLDLDEIFNEVNLFIKNYI
tara:strand:- start:37 stop:795 length:759 start_codon:yes stop_codon:yes gene_type:complete